ncbi:type IV pilus modification protein PilV [Kushneria marisflavi]|uniref:Type IV pilus modification protein PilV n=1 Tax=Kushneria marisflavi TaxID=157779 RepID=A0A240UND0_9GAMM|nr:type IV pilus modification protein PilV [Kushneria marisflavi]ART62529.1 type IV pilus modification protein PilV [Kushneria marisflavi]RKD84098.1 type IV pilus assembly protein PilV [Kushneria marisflavi]
MMSHTCIPPSQRGFSLLEVLVAMVVLSLGAMGVMSLVLHAQQANEQALQRGRATLLVNDMLERLRANATRDAMPIYNVGESAHAPIGDLQQKNGSDCRQSTCDSQTMARFDLADWGQQITQAPGKSYRLDGLQQAHACISITSQAQRFDATVTLVWRGTGRGSAPDATVCGSSDITSARQSVTASSRYHPVGS